VPDADIRIAEIVGETAAHVPAGVRADTPKMTVGEDQAYFDKQAADLSDRSRQIRAVVLSAAL